MWLGHIKSVLCGIIMLDTQKYNFFKIHRTSQNNSYKEEILTSQISTI